MKTIAINRFDRGIANHRNERGTALCGVCKHFDVSTFPNKIVPYRSVSDDTTGQTSVQNIITDSRGHVFGLGLDGSSHGQLYKKTTPAGAWTTMLNGATGQNQTAYGLLIEFVDNIYFASRNGGGNGIVFVDQSDVAGITFHSLAWTTIANGVIHPKTGNLYIPYDNKIAMRTVGGTWTDVALTLPSNATITSITPYGNYLAIAAVIGSSTAPRSKVYFWDVVTAPGSVWVDVVDWGSDYLQVVNTLYGVLVGISIRDSAGDSLDRNSLLVKGFEAGELAVIKEFSTEKQTSTQPSAQINPNINFTFGGKLYFSADIVGGSTSPAYYGLWSLSKSRLTGEWCLAIEQQATNDNSETSVLAAAKIGDYTYFVHTAAGTLTRSNSMVAVSSTTFAATSFYETTVNPNMPEADYELKKQLKGVRLTFKLPDSTSQVVLKYRADGATSWTTIFTKTSASPNTDTTGYRTTVPASGQFTAARYYEFRIESVGGAEITGLSYDYDVLPD